MKLSLVTETFPPEVNGVAMTLHRLVTGMVERGHRVEVVRPRQGRGDRPASNGQLHELTVPGLPLPRYDGLRMGLPARSRLMQRWRMETPDVVHIATEGPLGITALWAARKLGVPVTSSFHTNFHQYGKHYGYGFLARGVLGYLRHVHNRTCCTMAPSTDLCETLRGDGFQNVMLLARGVDNELFNPLRRSEELRRQWGAGPGDLVAVYVGRVAGEKNIPLAIEAFEAMKRHAPGMKFVIVGDGPARAGLQAKHPEYVYAGMQRGGALAAHYASGDVFLFPSTTETYGNVVTEGLASGLCVLGFDYAAAQKLIRSGENGVTVPFGDRAAFIAAAERLAQDPAAVKRMGEAAHASVAGLSWGAIIDRFESTLRQAADNGQVTLLD